MHRLNTVKVVFSAFLAILLLSFIQLAEAGKTTVRLINVRHDGYCFYHAVNALTHQSDSGQDLCDALCRFVTDSHHHTYLNELLGHYLIGSDADQLLEQLNQPLLPGERTYWPSQAHAVAMSLMLSRPILVLLLSSDNELMPESFLIAANGVVPVHTLSDDFIPVPDLQLVLAGANWFALDYQSEDAGQSLFEYMHQLTCFFSTKRQAQPEAGHMTLEPGLAMLQYPDFSFEYESHIHNQMNLQGIILSIINHARRHVSTRAGSSVAQIDSQFTLSDSDLYLLQEQVATAFSLLQGTITLTLLGNALMDYQAYTGVSAGQLLRQVNPAGILWPLLNVLRPIMASMVRYQLSSQSLDGIIAGCWINSQKTDATGLTGPVTFENPPPELSSGATHPDSLSIAAGQHIIPFDPEDPLHHVLFAIFVTTRLYNMVNQALLVVISGTVGLSDAERQLQKILVFSGRKRGTAVERLNHLRQHLNHLRDCLDVFVHALGREYFSGQWQPVIYICLTIQNGEFVIFHSDDFAPRSGWRDLWPPEPEGKKKRRKNK